MTRQRDLKGKEDEVRAAVRNHTLTGTVQIEDASLARNIKRAVIVVAAKRFTRMTRRCSQSDAC